MSSASHEGAMRTRGLTIAHLTDLGAQSDVAFEHALGLSITSRSALASIHANDAPSTLDRLPFAHAQLVRWGKLPHDAVLGDEAKLGIAHSRMVENCCDDVVDTLLTLLARTRPDLVVAKTRAQAVVRRVLGGSVAESIARQVPAPTLLLSDVARPLVQRADGALALTRVLVAAGDASALHAGLHGALWFADVAGVDVVEIELFYLGDLAGAPVPPSVTRAHTRVSVRCVEHGDLASELTARARAWPADLLVMATRGHDGLRDVLVGSHTEQALHGAPCPLLSIPLV